MGITDIFDEGKANLGGLLESGKRETISKTIHKAVIEIDEEGTEVVAATGNANLKKC